MSAGTQTQDGLYTVRDLQTRFGNDVLVHVLDNDASVVSAELERHSKVNRGVGFAVVISVIAAAAALAGYALALSRLHAPAVVPAGAPQRTAAAVAHARPPTSPSRPAAASAERAQPAAVPSSHCAAASTAAGSATAQAPVGATVQPPATSSAAARRREPRTRSGVIERQRAEAEEDEAATEAAIFSDLQALKRASSSAH
jgi:hypothetical protein